MASLILVGKVTLVAFIVLGCSILVTAYIRRRRTIRPMRNPYAAGYLDLVNGGVPPTPLPDWAVGDDPAGAGPGVDPPDRR